MMLQKTKNKKVVTLFLKHLILMLFIFIISIFCFFKIFLPLHTKHGQEILVPDLKGLLIEDAKKTLEKKRLRIYVKDQNSYSIKFLPNSILYQDPMPNTYVKENRTIYVALNASQPPYIKMPNLLNGSKRNAQLILKANDLKLGNIKYVSDISINCVLAQKFKNNDIQPGEEIRKGSKIDLTIGAGLSKKRVYVPNLIGKTEEEARNILKKKALSLGAVIYEKLPSREYTEDNENEFIQKGLIFNQIPSPEEKTYLGNVIDIWIYSNHLNKN